MKKVLFKNKETNTEKVLMVGNVGENVFPLCQNVKETNDAIRWCNTHNKFGEKFECDSYSLEIVEK